MRSVSSKFMMVAALASLASFSIGCAGETDVGPDEDLYPVDRAELADESIADEIDVEPGVEEALAEPKACQPGSIHGSVGRLFVDAQGRVRAQGTVFSDTAPCPTTVVIRLTRGGTRIDSQEKHCAVESCTSRLLSAGNPPGNQKFCANVRSSATGPVLDQRCITR
jgi:hypothetical protein